MILIIFIVSMWNLDIVHLKLLIYKVPSPYWVQKINKSKDKIPVYSKNEMRLGHKWSNVKIGYFMYFFEKKVFTSRIQN